MEIISISDIYLNIFDFFFGLKNKGRIRLSEKKKTENETCINSYGIILIDL